MSDNFCPVDRDLNEHLDSEHDCSEEGHVWGRTRNLRAGLHTKCEVCGEEDFDPNDCFDADEYGSGR